MSCPRYRDTVVLLVDGELSDDAAHGVKAHLMGCDGFRAFATELERLASQLRPEQSQGITHDEVRFWRKFEADLAVRVAHGETPWWKRTLVIPVPAMGALAIMLAGTGLMAGRSHYREQELEHRARQLSTVLRDMRENSVAAATVRLPSDVQDSVDAIDTVRTVDVAMSPLAPALSSERPRRSLNATSIKAFPPGRSSRPKIRFVDSDGVLQPGDLY